MNARTCTRTHRHTHAHMYVYAQSIGQLTYLRPFVEDFSPAWLAGNSMALVAGAMALVYIAGV